MSQIINNVLYIAPTSVVTIDSSGLSGVTVGGSGALAIVGECQSGQPDTALLFSSPAQAATVLGSGNLLSAIQRAFSPSADIPGAPYIYAVRVNPGTQSQLTLDASSTACMTLTSIDYGSQTRQIRVQVGTGTNGIGKDIQVQYGSYLNQNAQVSYNAIAVQYIDTSTPVYTNITLGVAGTTLTVTYTPVSGSPTTQTVDMTVYTTLQAIVDLINSWGTGWSASVTALTGNQPSTYLDEFAATTVWFAHGTSSPPVQFYGNWQAALDFFNTQSGFVTAAVGSVRKAPDNTTGWVYLGSDLTAHEGNDYGYDISGNPKTASTYTDWGNALNVLLPVDVSIVCAASGDASVHAMVQAHVDQASSPQGKNERVAIVGGVSGESLSAVQTRAQGLRDPRVMLVWPGGTDLSPVNSFVTGSTISVPPYNVAAQLGGMFCGGGVADALTHRYVTLQGIEQTLTAAQIDQALQSGICVIQNVPNKGFRIAQSVSTWTADSNYINVELSVRRAADELAKRLRSAVDDTLVGRTVGPNLMSLAYSITDSVCRQATTDGILVGSPSYTNIQVTANGDLVTIDFSASVAIPANYIQITAHLSPFTGTITTSTPALTS